MNRRAPVPAGWRKLPETTAEPVPLHPPFAGAGEDVPPGCTPAPRPRPHFTPRSLPIQPPPPPVSAPGATIRTPDGTVPAPGDRGRAVRLPDGTVLPPGTVRLSDGTVAAARPPAPAQHPAPTAAPAMGRWRPMHAVIGDELRKPVLWCEFGPCVARFTDDDALGERDLRARALAAGWCYDALGRLACPSCAQYDAAFWSSNPPAPVPRA